MSPALTYGLQCAAWGLGLPLAFLLLVWLIRRAA